MAFEAGHALFEMWERNPERQTLLRRVPPGKEFQLIELCVLLRILECLERS
jgi:hypothetical protein